MKKTIGIFLLAISLGPVISYACLGALAPCGYGVYKSCSNCCDGKAQGADICNGP